MNLKNLERLILVYSCAILILFFLVLAPQVFITESELWSIALGYHLKTDFIHQWVFTRPLFYFLLWLVQIPFEDPTYSVWATRSLFAVNALVIGYFMFKISRHLTLSVWPAVLSLIFLFGNTGFMNQGFRVRSDLLSITLALIGLYWILNYKFVPTKSIWKLFAPLLATPKALLHIGPLLLTQFKGFKKIRPTYIYLSLFCLALWIGLNFYNISFLSHYFFQNTGPAYWSHDAWAHVFIQFQRNPAFWMIFLLSIFQLPKLYQRYKVLTIFALTAFLAMLFAPGKTHFLIASFLPIFALYNSVFLATLAERPMAQRSLVIASCLASVFTGGFWFAKNMEENLNREQLKTLSAIYETLQKNNKISFFDGTCLIPSLCSYRYFIGPNQPEANKNAFFMVNSQPPQIIFYLKKSTYLEPDLSQLLDKKYVDLDNGLFVLSQDENRDDLLKVPAYRELHENIRNRLDYLFGYDLEY